MKTINKTFIISASSLIFAATPVLGAFAADPSTLGGTHDVTVGTVDEPVYSVDLTWGDLAFDWKYDSTANKSNFVPHYRCDAVSTVADGKPWIEYQRDQGWLFSDEACAQAYTGEIATGTTYYAISDGAAKSSILVKDNSVYGKVKATASFTPETAYSWTTGVFGKTDSGWKGPDVTPTEPTFITFTDGVLTETHTGSNSYYGELRLARNASAPAEPTVSTDDKIGTVTISIAPKTD